MAFFFSSLFVEVCSAGSSTKDDFLGKTTTTNVLGKTTTTNVAREKGENEAFPMHSRTKP